MSNDLIHDIEESIKQERVERLWKEYGSYVIAACVMAVLFTAIITGWRSWNASVNARDTALLLSALDGENQAQKLDDIASSLRGGQQAVANLTAAGLLVQDDKLEEALVHYNAASENSALPLVFRDLATYLSVRTEWSMDQDDMQADSLIAKLSPIIESQSNDWRWHARVLAAMIYASDMQDYSAARQVLAPVLQQRDMPFSLAQTARSLDQVYAQKVNEMNSGSDGAKIQEPEG